MSPPSAPPPPPPTPGPTASDKVAAPATNKDASKNTQPRDAWFDNAKYAAILLVVAGHSWEPLKEGSHLVKAAYLFVYTFHMPAFILISGYFAKNFDAQPRRVRRLITTIAVPYVIFETAYTWFRNTLDDRNADISLLDPWWLTWFLMAMFLWRLTSPIWRVIRWPVAVSVAFSLVVSTWKLPDALEMNRLFQLLPFFVLGMTLKRKHLAVLHRTPVRIAAAITLLCAFATAYVAAPLHVQEFFYWRSDRQHFDSLSFEHWFAMRCGMLLCAAACTAAFLSLIPRRHGWYSTLGVGSVYAYLLHGFLVKGATFTGVYDHAELHTPLGTIAVTLVYLTFGTLLCTPQVRRLFKYVVEPEMRWAFRPEQPRDSGRNRTNQAAPASASAGEPPARDQHTNAV